MGWENESNGNIMPTNKSRNDYISDADLYILYKKLAKSGKILKGSISWSRMGAVLKRLKENAIKRTNKKLRKEK